VTSAHYPLFYGLAKVIDSLYKGGTFLQLPSGVLDDLHLILVEGLVNNASYEGEVFRPSRIGQRQRGGQDIELAAAGQRRRVWPQRLQEFPAVHQGHVQVEQNERRRLGRQVGYQRVQRLFGLGKRADGGGKAGLTQHLLGHEPADVFVVDEIGKHRQGVRHTR
jgi:hypothetical protein